MSSYSKRAPFNDWWYWSECLVKRFRTIAEIYRENAEIDRANDAALWVKKLQSNCQPPVEAMRKGMKTDEQKAEIKRLEEVAIAECAVMFRELLVNLPFISQSMQDLTYTAWDECKWEEPPQQGDSDADGDAPIAKKSKTDARLTELFWGPKQRADEGIRSGKVPDGGLPGILYNLLVAERTSSTRAPTDYGRVMQASATQQRVSNVKMAHKMAPGRV